MSTKQAFYQESGKINPLKQSISYLISIPIALILGYVYSVLIIFIPIIYLNFLIGIGLGLALGFICQFLFRLNHNRSKRSRIIQAVVIGLLVNYFQWLAYILWAFDGTMPGVDLYLLNLHWILNPESFFAAIVDINNVGVWEMFGTQLKGFGLSLIWIFEFLIIMAGPIVAVIKSHAVPYSELQQKWYPKFTLFLDFESFSAVNQLMIDLESNPLNTIEELGKGSGNRFVKIHVFYLKEENHQYLTFEKIHIEVKKDGKTKTNSSIILNNFRINSTDAKEILDKFENSKERLGLF